ncbi:MAG: hypothetical protein QMD82_05455, partial [bacterium]|nr:hypothetical protein [bacterium]
HLKQELVPLPLIIQEATLLELDILELREAVLREMSSNPLMDIDKYSDYKVLAAKYEDLTKLAEIMEENVEWHGEDEEGDLKVRRDELIPAQEVSAWEKLEIQIDSYFDDENEKRIATSILEHLDGFGYLDKDPEVLSKELGVSLDDFERIRRTVIEFEPFGCGCRDFNEFVLLQAQDKGYSISPSEVQDFLKNNEEFRKKLIPYPFFQEEVERTRYVIPELIYKYVEGKLTLFVNENFYPQVHISKDYLLLLQEPSQDEKTRKYLEEKYKRIERLLESILKRKNYLRKLGELILEYQEDFLTGKTNRLRPITQVEASKKLEMPISTLNRLLKNKFADTPRGIYSLKFFFHRPFGKGSSSSISTEDLEDKVKKIIESEDKNKPYTDEEIANLLRSSGIKISRRMVTKLRNKLGIPDSRQRKN